MDMCLIKKITLSVNFSSLLFYTSLAFFIYNFYLLLPHIDFALYNQQLFIFLTSAFIIYPVIDKSWYNVNNYWEQEVADTGKTYSDFFVNDCDEETSNKMVKEHWKKTAWIVPYVLFVYSYVVISMISKYGISYLPLIFFGSLFMISLISIKYQREILNKD